MTPTPVSFAATVGTVKDGDGRYNTSPAAGGAVPASTTVATDEATVVTDEATVVTDVATLVADGASPTQAHVTALNTHWGALKTALDSYKSTVDSYKSTVGTLTGNHVAVVFDSTAITNMNQLKSALDNIVRQIAGSGLLTL